jgi:hypothetical protein
MEEAVIVPSYELFDNYENTIASKSNSSRNIPVKTNAVIETRRCR